MVCVIMKIKTLGQLTRHKEVKGQNRPLDKLKGLNIKITEDLRQTMENGVKTQSKIMKKFRSFVSNVSNILDFFSKVKVN